ncbi:TraB/GumN family protein [Lysobacter auxotrophicus]|uniref:TraB/GumN family protein n=1 Tax=Lysobacter auxotrophicus TaxID=2992573 RepID=A0ABM8DFV0_9GAMM|nr:TraB/GumN family protein [Lysobacter auxotrophicus]BDU17488.1 TraB/GumN family protein [Lysobacter auxotrophicus]
MLAAFAIGTASAQPAPEVPLPPIRDLETMVVSGIQPGPGLWKVRKGEHTLWILGTVSPLPRRMEWESREVEQAIAQSQELIEPPAVRIDTDLGFFGTLALAPKAFSARKNPDGQTLQEVVPPDMYARWAVLKRKYIGSDRGVESYRPILAAMELYQEAIQDVGLKQGGVVWPVVEKLAKRHKVPRTQTMVTVMIQDPKVALKEFRSARLQDLDCFAKTLDRLESDLGTMRERANAWAVGDLESLKALPYTDQNEACLRAAAESDVLRKRTRDIEGQVAARWLGAAEAALSKNMTTFAVLPMRELTRPDGFVARLKAKGYVVEEP